MSSDIPRFLPRLRSLPLPGLQQRRHAVSDPENSCAADTVREGPRLEVPIRETPPERAARAALLERGQRFARQECWPDLDEALRGADLSRGRTPGGTPEVRLLCDGAVRDLVARAAEAVARGDPEAARSAVLGFTGPLGTTTENPMRALLAASANLAVAELWRGAATSLPGPQRAAAVHDLLEAAHLLLRPHGTRTLGSAGIAAGNCAVIEVLPHPEARLARAYEPLIEADPECADHLRAYGRDLSPRRFGTWHDLDRAARRIALLTAQAWGHGGYCWVWMDALADQPQALAFVDPEFFVAGLHDIIQGRAHRPADQHLANLLAAFCARLRAAPGGDEESSASRPESTRSRLAGCLGWIASDHLREIHPELWIGPAGETTAPDATRIDAGTQAAREVLSDLFAYQLDRGRSVIFTEDGVLVEPSGCGSCALAPCAALAYPRLNLRDEDPPCLT